MTLLNIQKGIRTPKSESERFQEFFAIEGQIEANRVKRYYAEEIENATTMDQIARLKDARKAAIDQIKIDFPAYALIASDVPEGFSKPRIEKQLNGVQSLITYLEDRDGELGDTAYFLKESIKVYKYYKSEIKGLQGTSAEKRASKRRLTAIMDAAFAEIKQESEQAKRFIEAVLEGDPDFVMEESR